MDSNFIFSIALLVFSILFIIAMLMMIVLVALGFAFSYVYEVLYKRAVINVVLSNPAKKDQDLLESIKTEYKNYRNAKINAFSYLDIEIINAKLVSELRSDRYKKYYTSQKVKANDIANKLERVNKLIYEERNFNLDELNNVVERIQSLSVAKEDEKKVYDIVEKIKVRFFSCLSYCNGRIFEKDIIIYNLESKLKRNHMNKFFSWLGWIIGVISGIVTIYLWLRGGN